MSKKHDIKGNGRKSGFFERGGAALIVFVQKQRFLSGKVLSTVWRGEGNRAPTPCLDFNLKKPGQDPEIFKGVPPKKKMWEGFTGEDCRRFPFF